MTLTFKVVLFTWNNDPAYNNREIDIEFSRWGNADSLLNAQYVVQPGSVAGNLLRFTQPPQAQSTHSFTWRSDSIAFQSYSGLVSPPVYPESVINEWSYTNISNIPLAGGENIRMNFWLMNGKRPLNGQSAEVIVSGFEFMPAQ